MGALREIEELCVPLRLIDQVNLALLVLDEKPGTWIALQTHDFCYEKREGFDVAHLRSMRDDLYTLSDVLIRTGLFHTETRRTQFELLSLKITLPLPSRNAPRVHTAKARTSSRKQTQLENVYTYHNPLEFHTYDELFVATTPKTLSNLVYAHATGDDHVFGLNLGFPKTAVDTYVHKKQRFNERNLEKTTIFKRFRKNPGSINELYEPVPKELHFFMGYVFSDEYFEEELQTSWRWHDAIKENSPRLYARIQKRYARC
ncbi:hypothetical protein COT72_03055 [archaeon CG10_big_fil_rev_8_21_14_0_10_43_11]|nr:MAG: hypothetical protein COT72_03055 [archaeon CG10_big_fil_rev_8_21_14_0_10_43_11]